MASSLFCCGEYQPYRPQHLDHEARFTAFMKWAAFPKESSVEDVTTSVNDISRSSFAIQLVKQINFGALEWKKYFVPDEGKAGEFVQVSEDDLIRANFQKVNTWVIFKVMSNLEEILTMILAIRTTGVGHTISSSRLMCINMTRSIDTTGVRHWRDLPGILISTRLVLIQKLGDQKSLIKPILQRIHRRVSDWHQPWLQRLQMYLGQQILIVMCTYHTRQEGMGTDSLGAVGMMTRPHQTKTSQRVIRSAAIADIAITKRFRLDT